MKIKRLKNIIFPLISINPVILSASCMSNSKQKSEIKENYLESLVTNLEKYDVEGKYLKTLDNYSLNKYNVLTKKDIDLKSLKITLENKNSAYEQMIDNFNKFAKIYNYDDLKTIENLSMQQRIDKYAGKNRFNIPNQLISDRSDIYNLYQDAFDTSLSYLISNYMPSDLNIFDVYNYIKNLIEKNNIDLLLDNEGDNIFRIYNDAEIKSMIEIPVKIINFNRNFINQEVNVAYNEGSDFWDATNYNDVYIKQIINNRNIEIDPINLHESLYQKLESNNKQDKISGNLLRKYITNPYYSQAIEELKNQLNGIKGYQISYYGTKVRVFLDHEVTDNDLEIIKGWKLYDDYIPAELNTANRYKYIKSINDVVKDNLKIRDIQVINDFHKYKDYILGTRIFADFRNMNTNIQSFEYIKDKKDINLKSNIKTAFGLKQIHEFTQDELTNLITYFQSNISDEENNIKGFTFVDGNFIKSGQTWSKNESNYSQYIDHINDNLYPSLTVAQKHINNYEPYNYYDYKVELKNNVIANEPVVNFIDLKVRGLKNWHQGNLLSILPEKTFINKNTNNFKSLYKDNHELTYNLDWKVVSYAMMPFDLNNLYSQYNKNYQNLKNYVNTMLENNDVEIARIGIDQLSLR